MGLCQGSPEETVCGSQSRILRSDHCEPQAAKYDRESGLDSRSIVLPTCRMKMRQLADFELMAFLMIRFADMITVKQGWSCAEGGFFAFSASFFSELD